MSAVSVSDLGLAIRVAKKIGAEHVGAFGHWNENIGQAYLDVIRYANPHRGDGGDRVAYAMTFLPGKLKWRHLRDQGRRRIGGKWTRVTFPLRATDHHRVARPMAPRDERIPRVLAALSELRSDRRWEALYLVALGLSHRQIAPAMGITEGYVGDHVSGAVRDIRAALGVNLPKPHRPQSGVAGVTWDSFTDQWRGAVKMDGRVYRTARFDRLEDAIAAHTELRRVCGASAPAGEGGGKW